MNVRIQHDKARDHGLQERSSKHMAAGDQDIRPSAAGLHAARILCQIVTDRRFFQQVITDIAEIRRGPFFPYLVSSVMEQIQFFVKLLHQDLCRLTAAEGIDLQYIFQDRRHFADRLGPAAAAEGIRIQTA